VNARLNRLFAADGRCFDVAVDHGFFGEGSLLAGIEDMARTVATLVEAGPDAIQLSPGQAELLQSVPGPGKPALVLRTDVANIYGGSPPSRLFSQVV
jgi:fructose-bisphosphate aldolase, class I